MLSSASSPYCYCNSIYFQLLQWCGMDHYLPDFSACSEIHFYFGERLYLLHTGKEVPFPAQSESLSLHVWCFFLCCWSTQLNGICLQLWICYYNMYQYNYFILVWFLVNGKKITTKKKHFRDDTYINSLQIIFTRLLNLWWWRVIIQKLWHLKKWFPWNSFIKPFHAECGYWTCPALSLEDSTVSIRDIRMKMLC